MKTSALVKTMVALSALIGSTATIAEGSESTSISAGLAVDQDLSAVLELDNQYRFTVGNDGAAFDYIIKRGEFSESTPFTWYIGAGVWSEWDHNEFGARVPLGLNWNFSQGWNMYGQVHPELDLYSGPELQIGGALGVKYTF
ncbi:hypothetical protein L1D15_08495 [Vibrio sp. Isolate25]|uniref:hypothetical protein n=1 Tax=unclassified Vibrio TaxID=2614977 RepID=UPI001EFE924C|nr:MULTISPECIES: hypothetical protein [unclassified Vibrio]MCG9596763.1 hypothetical protein [Vibrio sp. Isolate25]MCG9679680.1 hypothetical protein [Vibrio sp. Isolate24]